MLVSNFKNIRSLLFSAIVLFALAVSLFPTAPAAAAGGTSPDLRVCMKYSNGAAYAGKAIYLYKHVNGAWQYTKRVQTSNSSGCTTFVDVQKAVYFYAQGYWTYGWWNPQTYTQEIYYYNGYTPAKWVGTCNCTFGTGGTVYGPYRLN